MIYYVSLPNIFNYWSPLCLHLFHCSKHFCLKFSLKLPTNSYVYLSTVAKWIPLWQIWIRMFKILGSSLIRSKMSRLTSILLPFFHKINFSASISYILSSCSPPILKSVKHLCPCKTFQQRHKHSIFGPSVVVLELLRCFLDSWCTPPAWSVTLHRSPTREHLLETSDSICC